MKSKLRGTQTRSRDSQLTKGIQKRIGKSWSGTNLIAIFAQAHRQQSQDQHHPAPSRALGQGSEDRHANHATKSAPKDLIDISYLATVMTKLWKNNRIFLCSSRIQKNPNRMQPKECLKHVGTTMDIPSATHIKSCHFWGLDSDLDKPGH